MEYEEKVKRYKEYESFVKAEYKKQILGLIENKDKYFIEHKDILIDNISHWVAIGMSVLRILNEEKGYHWVMHAAHIETILEQVPYNLKKDKLLRKGIKET
jgi:hypothetical protein